MQQSIYYAVAIVVSLALNGCGAPAGTEPIGGSTPNAAGSGHGEHAHRDHIHENGQGMSDMEKMKAELAKLPLEDAASAEKQHFCPVSDEMLGTMGAPIKVDVNGQDVWICCEGCRGTLLEDPSKYLAKLAD